MLDETTFLNWCSALRISDDAKKVIENIRMSPPSRKVKSGRRSVSGTFPSRKMGVTIQFESHKNELPFIYELEHDPDVLEYYDQPPSIKINYIHSSGKNIGFYQTPDFFILRKNFAEWVECKTEEHLLKIESQQPNRYHRDENGKWLFPPGENYAAQLGLKYTVRSSKEINWVYQRNIEFLDDYYRGDLSIISESSEQIIIEELKREYGLSLDKLLKLTAGKCSPDDVFALIAFDRIYVDLYAFPISESDKVQVFTNQEAAKTYVAITKTENTYDRYPDQSIKLKVGSQINWDGRLWHIANHGSTKVTLVDSSSTVSEIPVTVFEDLIRKGLITGNPQPKVKEISDEIKKVLSKASSKDLAEANYRYEVVIDYIHRKQITDAVSKRTLYYWVSKYRKAEQIYGYGYLGLIPTPTKGNKKSKLPLLTRHLLDEFILNSYETLEQKKKYEVYTMFLAECQKRGIQSASYKTFCLEIKKRPRFEQTFKRQGRKSAYQVEPFYWSLEQTTPRHGERPFNVCHIDHTELDIELVDSVTGVNLGRPWMTFLMDAYSRRILAIYLTFDPPSYRSCMMVMRECVKRFGRFPQILVVDGGKEFSSTYFETLLAFYECTKKTRPPSEPRFGSIIERLFGTTNTRFVYNLQGNTQMMINPRQVAREVNPKERAVWTLPKLYERLCEWGYEVYDTIVHPALMQSPREHFAIGMNKVGERKHLFIPYNEEFKILTYPTVTKGTAKVIPEKGVKINNIYYWADAFRHPEIEGTQVPVRYDPFNMGKSFALVNGKWVECLSEHFKVFNNCSEKLLKVASQELRSCLKNHLGHNRRSIKRNIAI